jgi:hypothetical protein
MSTRGGSVRCLNYNECELRQRNSFIINDFDAVNFVTDVLVFFRGCGYLNRYRRVGNRLWQFPRQELSLGVRVGCGVQQTERVQFRNYDGPEQSHNKPISIQRRKIRFLQCTVVTVCCNIRLVAGIPPGLVMWDLWLDKVALGQVFSEYFGFPCQSSFHQFLHNHHHLSSRAGTIG